MATPFDFAEFTMQHARLSILETLWTAPEHSANDAVLAVALQEQGLPITRDRLRTELGWLAEQGLITLKHHSPSVVVAVLRERGEEVAHGRAIVPGIKRPAPGR